MGRVQWSLAQVKQLYVLEMNTVATGRFVLSSARSDTGRENSECTPEGFATLVQNYVG